MAEFLGSQSEAEPVSFDFQLQIANNIIKPTKPEKIHFEKSGLDLELFSSQFFV